MALSTPCDTCGTPLRDAVVTVRFTTYAVANGMAPGVRSIPVGRPHEYLLCAACVATLDRSSWLLETHGGVPPGVSG